MPVLTMASSKGGCGKTTIASILTAVLAGEGFDVALLDADPNGGAHRWAVNTYTGPKVASYAEPDKDRLAELLPILADRHAILIADTAGFGNLAATICMVGADAILIPVSPGEGDVVEARKTVGFIEGLARTARRPIPARVLPNRIRRGTTLSRHTLSEIEALALPRLQTTLSEAVSYGELGFSGALPVVGTAAAEIAALVAELRSLGWLSEPQAVRKDRKGVNLVRRKGVR
jgi:chromosome partitioning protein